MCRERDTHWNVQQWWECAIIIVMLWISFNTECHGVTTSIIKKKRNTICGTWYTIHVPYMREAGSHCTALPQWHSHIEYTSIQTQTFDCIKAKFFIIWFDFIWFDFRTVWISFSFTCVLVRLLYFFFRVCSSLFWTGYSQLTVELELWFLIFRHAAAVASEGIWTAEVFLFFGHANRNRRIFFAESRIWYFCFVLVVRCQPWDLGLRFAFKQEHRMFETKWKPHISVAIQYISQFNSTQAAPRHIHTQINIETETTTK